MAMKGSDEELPLSMVEENAQGIGSSFFSGGTLGITMSSCQKKVSKKLSQTSRNLQHV